MFQQARLKLTAWYLLIIMLISTAFSLVIYRVLSQEVNRFARIQRFRIERRLVSDDLSSVDNDLINDVKNRLVFILLGVNGGIFFISGGLSYFLAGRTLRPIKEMLDEQNQFISDASHELRTPLTSLKTAMEVSLRDKNLTIKDAKTLISENINDVDNLQSLSDNLLHLIQYQKPQNKIEITKISLLDLVTKSIHKIKPLAKNKDILIKNNVSDINIKGDFDELSRLLIIILDNAIKYSPKKSTVQINSKKIDNYVDVSITDEGIGIEKKDLSHIFDRFYRADSARSKTETGGYGLGLSIAKKIAQFHHASISVKSQPNHGSTFIINLPL